MNYTILVNDRPEFPNVDPDFDWWDDVLVQPASDEEEAVYQHWIDLDIKRNHMAKRNH